MKDKRERKKRALYIVGETFEGVTADTVGLPPLNLDLRLYFEPNKDASYSH